MRSRPPNPTPTPDADRVGDDGDAIEAAQVAEDATAAGAWSTRAAKLVLGLSLGLGIAETAFWARDGGSFPHLNVYVADSRFGVRLRPGATERVRVGPHRPALVRINADGFRGDAWPRPDGREILLVGDSQVFGLGVAEHQTLAASLERELGGAMHVLNAGVPTYGPLEYNDVLAELLPRRRPQVVVYVVNFANDLFEAERPNANRHRVWDGWAVRRETAPERPPSFPLRELLFRESHAVFAVRQLLHSPGATHDDRGFASEGTYRDVVAFAVSEDQVAASARAEAEAQGASVHLARAERDHLVANARFVALARELLPRSRGAGCPECADETLFDVRAAAANPGDIVEFGLGESARSVRVTAEHVRRGAILRAELERAIEQEVEREARATVADRARGILADRAETELRVERLQAARGELRIHASPLSPAIRAAKALCDAHGAELVVVALPMDVQVSEEEWLKYGERPIDMKPTLRLLTDLVHASRAMGVQAFDLTRTLSETAPGAFLRGDLHLSPRGHRAAAETIARALRAFSLVPARPGAATVPR